MKAVLSQALHDLDGALELRVVGCAAEPFGQVCELLHLSAVFTGKKIVSRTNYRRGYLVEQAQTPGERERWRVRLDRVERAITHMVREGRRRTEQREAKQDIFM